MITRNSYDTPLVENADPQCLKIDSQLEEANVFDAQIKGVDTHALIAEDREKAQRVCDKADTGLASCFHNEFLFLARQNHLNVYFQAKMVNQPSDGKNLSQVKLTVLGAETLGDVGGMEIMTSKSGAVIPSAHLTEVLYAPAALNILDQRK